MTLYEFNTMDEMEQLEVIWYNSSKLDEREDDVFLFVLYP